MLLGSFQRSPLMQKLAFSVSEFCEAHSISRSLFYKLLSNGKGPRLSRVGNRRLVTAEDAAEWRRSLAEGTAEHGRVSG
jgi:predicted DNA-binding transcriptional regulator AlpA